MLAIPSEIHKVETMVDGGNKLVVYTQELQPDDLMQLFTLKGQQGWFMFKESNFKQEDFKDLPDIKVETNKKSQSQKIRDCLFILWGQGSKKDNFEEYYKKQTDKIIDWLKSKLN